MSERVIVGLGVLVGVEVTDGVRVADPVGLGVMLGVEESDAPVLGVPVAVGAALGVGVAETGRPAMTTLSTRNVPGPHGWCEKRQQKPGAFDAFPANVPDV